MENQTGWEQPQDDKNDAGSGSFLKDLGQFLWEKKLWWMVPILLVLVLVAVLLFIASTAGPAAPFIYSLF